MMLKSWTYSLAALLIILIIGAGLGLVIKEGIEVAGFAHDNPDRGRKVMHNKNITRLSGSVEALDAYFGKYFAGHAPGKGTLPASDNWQAYAKSRIEVNPAAKHAVVLPSQGDEALAWALPGLFWARFYGAPVWFPEDLSERPAVSGQKFFVLAPPALIPDDQLQHVDDYQRIHGDDPADHAVQIAKYRDEACEFGWGREYDRRTGYFHFVMTTPADALKGLVALSLARSNAAALLYCADDGGVPAATDQYIWSQRSDWFVTPSEGPFRHFFIVSDRISYLAQGRIDLSVEKAEYASYGPVALGPMDGIAIVFLALGIAGGILVFLHSAYFMQEASLAMKIAWVFGAALLPVLGLWLYFSAYRRPTFVEKGKVRWLRPPVMQSAAATMMGFGFGAPLMIAIAYVFAFAGFPLFYPLWLHESVFWLGAGMPFMMIMMYILAVLLAWLLVQAPMKAEMMDMSKAKTLWMSLKTTAISMAMVSLGMMTMSWFMMMWHIRMMPKEDDILWFFSMWLASFMGFLAAWPLNWLMIRKNLKPGNL